MSLPFFPTLIILPLQCSSFKNAEFLFNNYPGMSASFNKGNETTNKTKSGKEADDKSITLKSAKIFPNTWRPR